MGRCVAGYTRKSVGFKYSRYRKVSPLAQNKKGLDRVVMRSSVFMADMIYIALRSKIQSKCMNLSLFGFHVMILFEDIGVL